SNIDTKIENFLSSQKINEIEKYHIVATIKPFIKVNLKINTELTEKRREEAKKSVKPVIIKIEKGEIIFEKGTTIGDKEIELLKKYGLLFTIKDIPKILYSIIIAFLLSLLFFIFVNSNIKISQKELYFLIVILTLALVAGRFVPDPYLIPLPFFAMLSFLFFSFSASTLFILTAYFFYILFFPEQIIFLTLFLLVSLFLSMQVKRIKNMGDFLKIGLGIGAISSIFLILFSILMKNTEGIILNSIILFINGTFSSIVLAGLVPHIERLLSISTPLGLVELLNINNPLLNEFILKAPGSYQHSINVSTLAQVAADAIGENALLAKVGAYYHDIGKMLRPQFFIENQSPGINPHDSISPSLSALIIISHVKDGVDIAKKYKLPKEITDIIAEHHGTTLVTYFYRKAKELDPDVRKDTFRYPGPLPSSKVSGIIMLADSIEATARSEKLEKKEDFVDLVDSIIKTKIEDGQLENSDLSFKEINKIKEAFVKVLMSVYHERISYNEKGGNFRERGKDTGKEG
ncbi:MAG: phosphohydrolase, partial [Caldiserica bacterium]